MRGNELGVSALVEVSSPGIACCMIAIRMEYVRTSVKRTHSPSNKLALIDTIIISVLHSVDLGQTFTISSLILYNRDSAMCRYLNYPFSYPCSGEV